jgi:hypothetical protein
MEQEREFDQYLGGAPREAVQEFKKPGELSEDDLMDVLAGVSNRSVAVDMQLQNEDLFRRTAVDNEKAAMFQELDQQSQKQEISNQHRM